MSLVLRRAIVASLVSALLVSGCTSWTGRALTQPLPAAAPVQVWRAGHALELQQVRLAPDSLSGVPAAPGAERVAIPCAAIDSVRVRRFDLGKTVLVVGGAVPAALSMLMWLVGAPEEL
jgi:hypothetical protein